MKNVWILISWLHHMCMNLINISHKFEYVFSYYKFSKMPTKMSSIVTDLDDKLRAYKYSYFPIFGYWDGSFENPQHIICFGCEIRIKIREGFQLFPGGEGGPNANVYRNPYNLWFTRGSGPPVPLLIRTMYLKI